MNNQERLPPPKRSGLYGDFDARLVAGPGSKKLTRTGVLAIDWLQITQLVKFEILVGRSSSRL